MAARVDAFLASGRAPRRAGQGLTLVLPGEGRSFVRLRDAGGTLTTAGRHYQERTGHQLQEADPSQAPVRRGNVEYIRDGRGAWREVRRWDPAARDWVYTARGRTFFSQRRSEYVVLLPVLKRGRRSNGSSYSVPGFMPLHWLGLDNIKVPQSFSTQQRDEAIKRQVLRKVEPDKAVHDVSGEEWFYDPEAPWRIEEMRTDPSEGKPRVSVLDRTLGAPVPAGLPKVELMLPEAFEEHGDRLCVARQLAAATGHELAKVLEDFDGLLGGVAWREHGLSARNVMQWAATRALGWRILHGETLESQGEPDLVFAVWEDHAYFYRPAAARHLEALTRRQGERVARVARSRKVPPVRDWLPLEDLLRLQPGAHYWTSDMEDARRWLLAAGQVPRVVLRDAWAIRSLVLHRKPDEQPVTLHHLPENWEVLARWLEALGLPYAGEGLPSAAFKALQALVKEQRVRQYLSGEQKALLLERHDFKCACCGGPFERGEWDHVFPLNQGGPQEFQPLCLGCHREKTALEPQPLETDLLASQFELGVWRAYVESPRMPPLVYRRQACENLAACEVADVIRCRRRALEFCSHPLPVFCPLDDVQQVTDQTLGDLNLVTRAATDPVTQLGYTGPGWQHRVLTEFLLESGVIEWPDVSHRLTATGRLPADLLRAPLRRMEEAWFEDEQGLAKRSVNALIGLWTLDEQWSYKHSSSSWPLDAPSGGEVSWRTFTFPGGEVHDWVQRTRLVTASSYRPLHDLCLSTEAARVGQMLRCLRQQRATVLELRTDSVLFQPRKRASRVLLHLRLEDLGADSKDLAFRLSRAGPSDRLAFEPSRPCREAPELPSPLGFQDLSPQEAAARVVNGESLLVLGLAGTGKSHYATDLVARLRAQGLKVDCIAKTHVASQRIHGTTCDAWVRRHVLHGSCGADVIWVDEIGQVDVAILAQLNKLARTSARWLLTGDFHQFPPVADSWRGCPVERGLRDSQLLARLAGGNRTRLTECRRADQRLFSFYSSLVGVGTRSVTTLAACVAEARREFGFPGHAEHNLVISHRHRVQLNARLNRALKPREALWVPVRRQVGDQNEAQSMYLWPGLKMLGCSHSEKEGIRNGVMYTLEAVDEEGVTLAGRRLPMEKVQRFLRLAHAQTYASCQGTEYSGTLRLWDTSSQHFTKTHLYVGLSRASSAATVAVS